MPLPNDEKLIKLSEDLIAKFQQLFGMHPGMRPAHAKGVLLTGTFTPADEAKKLSKAPHFANASTPVTVRFSDSTGVPVIPDTDPNSVPRGIAIRFHLGERTHTDIIAHSTDGFPTHTGAEFLELLTAIATSGPETPHPTPVEQFVGSHPAALAFVQAPKPFPASFGTETYFGVTAAKFISAGGEEQFFRYQVVPEAGNQYLDEAALKTKGPNYEFEEIVERVGAGPVTFTVKAQLAGVGDVVDDATVHWPAERRLATLGTLVIDKVVPNDAEEQRTVIFDPIPRVEGIEPSADPLLELRAAVYLISGRQRRAAK